MMILFFTLLVISIWGVKLSSFHEDYMSLTSTNVIKGIFAVIILYSHMRGYLTLTNSFEDRTYVTILRYIGQLMVAMYFFYSGYGIMESFKKKKNYGETFFKKRIVKTLLHFDIAVLLYIVLQTCLGKYYGPFVYLGSIIGWESVGNSNWFIFDIIALYIIVYISHRFNPLPIKKETHDSNSWSFLCVVFIQCVCLWFFLLITKKHSWWIDTIMTFPLGICFSLCRSKAEKILRNDSYYYIIIVSLVSIMILWRNYIGIDRYGFCACIFCLFIIVLSIKVKLDNKVLQWLGTQAFAIYILQRLPMLLFTSLGINSITPLFVILTIPSVLLLAYLYTKAIKALDIVLF